MRFIWAIAALIAAATMIVFGIAQRTLWLAPGSVSHSVVVQGDARYTVIGSDVLGAYPGAQTVTITGGPTVFMAYGRDADVQSWIGPDTHAVISLDAESGELTSRLDSNAPVDPTLSDNKPDPTKTPAPVDDAAAPADSEPATIVNPAGSDLWLEEFSTQSRLDTTVNIPDGISVLVAADGEQPAPARIQISWPLDNATPWAGPLLTGGALFAFIGVLLMLWGMWGVRRGRGPRRNMPKGPRLPRITMRPRAKALEAPVGSSEPTAIESGQKAERRSSSARKRVIIVPMFLVAGLALSGCSADLWPGGKPSTIEPSSTAAQTPSGTEAPVAVAPPMAAVTAPQLERIMRKIAVVTSDADAAADAALLSTRFTGPALAVREGNYAIRALVPDFEHPDPIPASALTIVLPQQTESWPRTVLAVVQNPEDPTNPPTALQLRQQSPRDNYRVEYAMRLEPDAQTPKVAPATIGATVVPPDNKLLVLPPSQLATAYADILTLGEESPFYDLFKAQGDSLRSQVGVEAQQALIAALPTTATMTFSKVPGTGTVTPLATLESGAIVAIDIAETEVIKPAEEGATVSPSGSVKAISQVEATTKGIQTNYITEILFYIPAAGSGEQIVLLGYAQGLISAAELP